MKPLDMRNQLDSLKDVFENQCTIMCEQEELIENIFDILENNIYSDEAPSALSKIRILISDYKGIK